MTLSDMLAAGVTIQGNGRITVFEGCNEVARHTFENEDDLCPYQIPEDMLDLEVVFLYADDVGLNIELTRETEE